MISTLAQFKARYGLSESEADDDAMTAILAAVSSRIALAMGRHIDGQACLEEAQRTEVFSPESHRRTLWMAARPVSRVLEVVEGAEGDFEDVDPLVEGDDYYVQGRRGGLLRKGGYWPAVYIASVQVTYIGGYTPPDALAADDFEAWETLAEYVVGDHVTSGDRHWECVVAHTAGETFEGDADDWREKFLMPTDLVDACLVQAGADWQRRSMVGLTSASSQGGTVSAREDGLLPAVEETVARYRDWMG